MLVLNSLADMPETTRYTGVPLSFFREVATVQAVQAVPGSTDSDTDISRRLQELQERTTTTTYDVARQPPVLTRRGIAFEDLLFSRLTNGITGLSEFGTTLSTVSLATDAVLCVLALTGLVTLQLSVRRLATLNKKPAGMVKARAKSDKGKAKKAKSQSSEHDQDLDRPPQPAVEAI